jgi:hypothetical protein
MKAIIRFNNNGEWNYICNYEIKTGKILNCSNSYQTGTLEFNSKEEAEKVAALLKLGGNKLRDWEVVHVK